MDFSNIISELGVSNKYFVTDTLNIKLSDLSNITIATKLWSFVHDLNDFTIEEVIPLTKYETYVIRRYSKVFANNHTREEIDNYSKKEAYESMLTNNINGSNKELLRIIDKLRSYFGIYVKMVRQNTQINQKCFKGLNSYVTYAPDMEFITDAFKKISHNTSISDIKISDFDSIDDKYLKHIFGEEKADKVKYMLISYFKEAVRKENLSVEVSLSDDIYNDYLNREVKMFTRLIFIPEADSKKLVDHGYGRHNLSSINDSVLSDLGIVNKIDIISNIDRFIIAESENLYYKGTYKFDPRIVDARKKVFKYSDDDSLNTHISSFYFKYTLIKKLYEIGLEKEDGSAPDIRFIKQEEIDSYLDYLKEKIENQVDFLPRIEDLLNKLDFFRNDIKGKCDDDFFLNNIDEEHILVDECNYDYIVSKLKEAIKNKKIKKYSKVAYDVFGMGASTLITDVLEKHRKPSKLYLEKLCKYLGINFDRLIEESNFDKKNYITIIINQNTGEKGVYIPEEISKENNIQLEKALKSSTILHNGGEDDLNVNLRQAYDEMLEWIDLGVYPDPVYFMKRYHLLQQYYHKIELVIKNKGLLDLVSKNSSSEIQFDKVDISKIKKEVEFYLSRDILITTDIQGQFITLFNVNPYKIRDILLEYQDEIERVKTVYLKYDLPLRMRFDIPNIKLAELDIYIQIKKGFKPTYSNIKERNRLSLCNYNITEEEFNKIMEKFSDLLVVKKPTERGENNMKNKLSRKSQSYLADIINAGVKVSTTDIGRKYNTAYGTAANIFSELKRICPSLCIDGRKNGKLGESIDENIKHDSSIRIPEKIDPISTGKSNEEDKIVSEFKGVAEVPENVVNNFKEHYKPLFTNKDVVNKDAVSFAVETDQNDKEVALAAVYNNLYLEASRKKRLIKKLLEERDKYIQYYACAHELILKYESELSSIDYFKEQACEEQLRREDIGEDIIYEPVKSFSESLDTLELVNEVYQNAVDYEKMYLQWVAACTSEKTFINKIAEIDKEIYYLTQEKDVYEEEALKTLYEGSTRLRK